MTLAHPAAAAPEPPARPPRRPRRSIASSLMWTAANSWSVQLVNLTVFVLLARLLEPSAFGLVAMAGVYVHISGILVDQGLSTALVQREDLRDEHKDTAFWLTIGTGLVLTGTGVALSGVIARLFREPALGPVVAALSFVFLIDSLSGVQRALLTRGFDFKLLAIRSFLAAVAGGVTGVAMAAAGYGVRALIWQQLVTALVGLVLLWAVAGWRPRLRFSRSSAGELLSFGGNVVGIRLLNATMRRSDDMLIGFFLGPAALGYYSVGYKVFKILVDVFTRIVSKVALPAFSELQSRTALLAKAFLDSIRLSSVIGFPIFVALAVLAPDVVPLFFGARWAASVPVMQVLGLMGILQTVHLLINQVLIAAGRPSWAFRFLLVSAAASVAAFALVVHWGIVAVAAAYTAVGYALSPVYLVMLRRLLGISTRAFLGSLRVATLASLGMGAAMLAARHLLAPRVEAPAALAIVCALGLTVYAAGVLLFGRSLIRSARAALGNRAVVTS